VFGRSDFSSGWVAVCDGTRRSRHPPGAFVAACAFVGEHCFFLRSPSLTRGTLALRDLATKCPKERLSLAEAAPFNTAVRVGSGTCIFRISHSFRNGRVTDKLRTAGRPSLVFSIPASSNPDNRSLFVRSIRPTARVLFGALLLFESCARARPCQTPELAAQTP